MLNVVELYAGTGRSAEPFRRSRETKVRLLVDASRVAKENYLLNFPNASYELISVGAKTSGSWLRDKAGGRIDVLLGCPPCQGFSDSGLRDRGDSRNAQLAHFGRVAVEARPQMVAMENVPGAALTPQFKRLIRRLETAGYCVTWSVLNSAVYGSTQSRQRLVLFAALEELKRTPRIPAATHGSGRYFSYTLGKVVDLEVDPVGILGITPASAAAVGAGRMAEAFGRRLIPTVGETLAGLPACGTQEAQRLGHVAWRHGPDMIARMSDVPEGGRYGDKGQYFSQAYARLHRRGLARTITTNFRNPGSGRFWHPTADRTLTLREAARLQGFPDSYKFEGIRTHDAILIGNALDAALAQLKYTVIRETLG